MPVTDPQQVLLTVIIVRKCSTSVTNKGLGILRPDSACLGSAGQSTGTRRRPHLPLHRYIQLSTYLDTIRASKPACSPTNALPALRPLTLGPAGPFSALAVGAGLPAAGRGLGLPCAEVRKGGGGGGDSVAETEVLAMAVNLSRNGPGAAGGLRERSTRSPRPTGGRRGGPGAGRAGRPGATARGRNADCRAPAPHPARLGSHSSLPCPLLVQL